MAAGFGLLVGLEYVDASVEERKSNFANGCLGVAQDLAIMEHILEIKGYQYIKILKNEQATSHQILKELVGVKNTMQKGDIFTFYYSGHGGCKFDVDGDEIEDHQDETLVVYDREIIDDELNAIWTQFPEGGRILMISDSCNSGTNYKAGNQNREKSKPILIDKTIDKKMKAMMIHIGACRDGQQTPGGTQEDGSPFTNGLEHCLKDHASIQGYKEFMDELKWYMNTNPEWDCYGPVNEHFLKETPFHIG